MERLAGWHQKNEEFNKRTRIQSQSEAHTIPYQLAVSVSQVGEHTYSSDDSDLYQIMAAPMSHLLMQSQAYNSLTEMD